MKNTLLILGVLVSQWAFAGKPETVEIVRSHQQVPLTLQLTEKTVRCLVGDYGASSLKISIPELKDYTVFRQTTRGETAPCINAGACKMSPNSPGLSPELILDPKKPTEDVTVDVTLKEVLSLDHETRSCHRSLSESLFSKVRGLEFMHVDGTDLGELSYETCLLMKEKN